MALDFADGEVPALHAWAKSGLRLRHRMGYKRGCDFLF
jgi:hypothetical protein